MEANAALYPVSGGGISSPSCFIDVPSFNGPEPCTQSHSWSSCLPTPELNLSEVPRKECLVSYNTLISMGSEFILISTMYPESTKAYGTWLALNKY